MLEVMKSQCSDGVPGERVNLYVEDVPAGGKLRGRGESDHEGVCRVLIQYASRSGRASGSQYSSRTILWSLLRKSCNLLEKWQYKGTRHFFFLFGEVPMSMKVKTVGS